MNRPRATSWIRVDLGDYLASQRLGMREAQRTLKSLTIPHPTPAAGVALDGFILQGFAISAIAGPPDTISVALGTSARAILSEAADATVYHGVMAEDELGAATVTVPVANFWGGVPGVYSIYIRFVTQPGNSGNRMFWSPSTASEYLNNQPTTDQPRFEIDGVAAGLPLGWTTCYKLGEVTLDAAGTVTLIAGMRNFLFEGHEDATPAYEPAWGDGANDRNANRASFGVHDLATFVQYTRRQVRDILGTKSGVLANPWSVVSGSLPSLGSLYLEHYEEAAGAPGEGHHRGSIHHVSGGPADIAEMVLRDVGGVEFIVGQHDLDTYMLRMRNNVAGAPGVFVRSDAPGSPGGLIISGPSGEGADLLAGEEAHLRFGRTDEAPWTDSRDFALVAVGAAGDPSRRLNFKVGNPSLTVAYLMGDGGFFSGYVQTTGTVRAGADVEATGNLRYVSVQTWYRSIALGPAARALNGSLGTPAASPHYWCQDITQMAGTAAVQHNWSLLFGAMATLGQPEEGLWGEREIANCNATISDTSASRLVLDASWLPNSSTIAIGIAAGLRCEADAAFLGVAAQRLEVVLCARNRVTGVLLYLAFAQFLPPAAIAQVTDNIGVAVAADYAAHGSIIDHATYEYFFAFGVYDGAAPGWTTGCAAASALDWPSEVTNLRH